jgi:hypothetical protein
MTGHDCMTGLICERSCFNGRIAMQFFWVCDAGFLHHVSHE